MNLIALKEEQQARRQKVLLDGSEGKGEGTKLLGIKTTGAERMVLKIVSQTECGTKLELIIFGGANSCKARL